MNELKVLSFWLKTNGFLKAAQAIDEIAELDEVTRQTEYDEPWHEEVVEEVGSEPISEEKYYKDNFFKENIFADLHEAIMEKEGFMHYTGGEEGGSYMASGAFGSVYRGIYNNKPAVIKITVDPIKATQPPEKDVENWRAILEAKKSMPLEKAKHIPEIYKLNKASIFDEYYQGDMSYSIVIMEELLPLNDHMKSVFYGYGKDQERTINALLQDENYLYKLSKLIVEKLSVLYPFKKIFSSSDSEEITSALNPEDVMKQMLTLSNLNKLSSKNIARRVAEYVSQIDEDKLYELFYNSGFQMHHTDLEDFFTHKIYEIINASIKPDGIPRYRSDMYREDAVGGKGAYYSAFLEESPETGEFYKTLESLYENFDITWSDVHIENIMLGQDGNLKIIDVGRYRVG